MEWGKFIKFPSVGCYIYENQYLLRKAEGSGEESFAF